MLYPKTAAEFQERARARKICLGVHTSGISPQLVELYGHLGLDYVILSTEVESVDKFTLENLLRSADAARTVPIVKLLRRDPLLVQEAMNAGAPMVMVPHVTSRAQLDELVKHSKFAPHGFRGVCPVSRYIGYGALSPDQAIPAANEAKSVIPIIEDREALPNLEEIVSSPDIDIVEFGPFDLSLSLGLRPEIGFGNPPVMEAVERLGALARKYKKGLLAPIWWPKDIDSSPKLLTHQMDQLIRRGVTAFYGTDVLILARIFRDWMGLREMAAD